MNKMWTNLLFIKLLVANWYYGAFVALLELLYFSGKQVASLSAKRLTPPRSLVVIFLLATVGALYRFFILNSYFDPYFTFRDVYYFMKPMWFIVLGFFVMAYYKDYRIVLKGLAVAIVLSNLYGLSLILLNPSMLVKVDLAARTEFGLIDFEAVVAFSILLLEKKHQLRLFSVNTRRFFYIVVIVRIIFSMTRTLYVIALLVWVLAKLKNTRWYRRAAVSMVVLMMSAIFLGEELAPYVTTDVDVVQGMTDKFKNSFSEVMVYDRQTMDRINRDWRGHEAFLGMKMFEQGDGFQKICGQGFGTVVYNDLFHGEKLEFIPFFHIGYVTVVLKSGIFGLILYIIFTLSLFRPLNVARTREQYVVAQFMAMSGVVLLVHTFVMHGLFTNGTQPLFLIFLGSSIYRWREISSKRKKLSLG